MYFWTQAPFFRLLLPFVTGIVLAVLFPQEKLRVPVFLCIAVLFTALLFISGRVRKFRYRWLFGIPVFLGLIAVGYFLTLMRTEKLLVQNYTGKGKFEWAAIRITEAPSPSFRATAEILTIRKDGLWERAGGKLLVYISGDNKEKVLYGSHLLVHSSSLREVPAPGNPYEFDYRRFLCFKGIYHRCFINSSNSILSGGNSGNGLRTFSYRMRDKLLSILEKYMLEKEKAIASALLLGYTAEIDKDTIREYSNTGVLHILSVSGMHVSLIYFLLDFLLKGLRFLRSFIGLRALLLLLFLWLYALMSGLSPAVLRASAMLSFVIIAELSGKRSAVFNTLFVSAFCLLLYDPYFITDIGFQLSYLAVGGILILQPPLYYSAEFKGLLPDLIWKSTTVSFAAQLLTFPLGLYYFGNFPNYFLLTNLFAVPLSALAIYSGMFLLSVSFSAWLSSLAGKLCTLVIRSLNECIHFFEGLPFSFTDGLSITCPETILLFSAVLFLCAGWMKKHIHFFFFGQLCIIACLLSFLVRDYRSVRQNEIIVYAVPGKQVIGIVKGNSDFTISNENSRDISRYTGNYRAAKNIRDNQHFPLSAVIRTDSLYYKDHFLGFCDRRLLLLDKDFTLPGKQIGKIRLDYIVISGRPSVDVNRLLAFFDFTGLVLSSDCPKDIVTKLKRECQKFKLQFHSTYESGAFLLPACISG